MNVKKIMPIYVIFENSLRKCKNFKQKEIRYHFIKKTEAYASSNQGFLALLFFIEWSLSMAKCYLKWF